MNATTHTDQALAVARETGWDLTAYADEREWEGVGIAPGGVHRESEIHARSNHRVIVADLSRRFGDAIDVAHFGHAMVGWVDEIVYDTGNADVRAQVAKWVAALEEYPVASDEDYSALELEELEHWIATLECAQRVDGVDYEPVSDGDPFIARMVELIGDYGCGFSIDNIPGEGDIIADAIEAGIYAPTA